MQKSEGSRSNIVKKSCYLRVKLKPGIPVPVDVVPVPDPTRTRGYGSGRVYPRVRVDPHTSSPVRLRVMLAWTTLCELAFQRRRYPRGVTPSKDLQWQRSSHGSKSAQQLIDMIFRLDAWALSVIATATWLAGWLAWLQGWLAGWLGVRHTPVLYQNG